MLFSKTPPIYETIDEYASWKCDLHPLIAGGQRSLLYRFSRSFKLERVEDIQERHIAFFIGEELTAFYSMQAMKAIRGFLRYCQYAGYDVVSWKVATEANLRKVGRKTEWEKVKMVKHLREGRGLSYAQIADEMSALFDKKVWRPSVIRWYKRAGELP